MPALHALGNYLDHRRLVNRHRPVLWVLFSEKSDRRRMLAMTGHYHLGRSIDQHISQPRPVVGVVVDHERDLRILANVLDAPKLLERDALRLAVQSRVNAPSIEYETHRHHKRTARRVGRREMANAMRADKRLSSFVDLERRHRSHSRLSVAA